MIDSQLVGGDSTNFSATFENEKSQKLPLYVRLNVSSQTVIEGEEFDVKAYLNSSNNNDWKYSEIGCRPLLRTGYDYRPREKNLIYSCHGKGLSAGEEVLPESDNDLNLSITTSTAIAPADFKFEMEALERIGEAVRKNSALDSTQGTLETGSTTVEFSSEETVDVDVWEYSDVFTQSPEGKDFISGADVIVSASGTRVNQCPGFVSIGADYFEEDGYWFDRFGCKRTADQASGTVKLEFSDQYIKDSVSMYWYDRDAREWNELESQEVNAVENYVEADVSEFKVFALFGEKQAQEETGGQDSQEDGGEPAAQSLGGTGSTTLNNDNVEVGETSDNSDNVDVSVDADFTYSQVEDSLQVDFDASSSTTEGVIESYSWDFGDDTSGTGETVSHEYSNGGLYPVNLTVETESGETDTASEIVEVEPLVEEDQLESPAGNENEETPNEESSAPPATAQFASQPATAASLATLIFIIIFLAIYLRREIIHKIRSLSPF